MRDKTATREWFVNAQKGLDLNVGHQESGGPKNNVSGAYAKGRIHSQGYTCKTISKPPGTNAQNLKKIWTISRFMRVILAQGPC